MNIEDCLRRIMANEYNLPPEKLVPEARLEDLGIDSLGMIELLFKLEDELHIRMPSEQVELSTVGDVMTYLHGLVPAQSTGSVTAGAST
jgi:acyl carrier protein